MRIVIFGRNGQLGKSLKDLQPKETQVFYSGRSDLDLSNTEELEACLKSLRPHVILNASAYTSVDGAEREVDLAHAINSEAPKTMAKYASSKNAKMVHISTDYVFDGFKQTAYLPDDEKNPKSEYGKSKLAGETALLKYAPKNSMIIRTSWLFSEYGSNFVKKMLDLISKKTEISVVSDQTGSPTYARALAEVVWLILMRNRFKAGVYHWTNSGKTTWFDFANRIKKLGASKGLINRPAQILPVSSEDFKTKALRPGFSVLDSQNLIKLVDQQPSNWEASLEEMLERLRSRTERDSLSENAKKSND